MELYSQLCTKHPELSWKVGWPLCKQIHQPQSLIPFGVLLSLQAREDHEGTGHESCSPDRQDFVRLKDHFSQVWGKLGQAHNSFVYW